ncbi:MAG: 30S ribosomal protein S7 [Candidatus Nanoarchaeia archaeon]
MKIFDKYDVEGVEVQDAGLKRVVNLQPKLMLKSHGRIKFDPSKKNVNVIERLVNLLQVPGSRGKKHKIITSWITGKFSKNVKIVMKAFDIIQEKTGKNPVEVFIQALENAAPRDGVTTIEYGGARYPQAVDISPRRRLNLALRWIVHGSYDKAFRKKDTIVNGLAKEIMLAADNSGESFAVQKRNDSEKQADAAR